MELSPILEDKVCHRSIVVFYTNPPPTILPLASGSRPGERKAKPKLTAMGRNKETGESSVEAKIVFECLTS